MKENKENRLVLELCQLYSDHKETIQTYLWDDDLNLPYVLGQLQFNRVGAVAFEILKQYGLLKDLNREFRTSLKSTWNENVRKTDSFLDTEAYLAELLKNADFPYALLKGAYLVQLYPKGLRTSNDIDILMREDDLSKIESILKAAGFTQGHIRNDEMKTATRAEIISSRMNRGETVPWIKEVNWVEEKYIEVDLNFSLDYKATGSRHLVQSFLNRIRPAIITRGGPLYTLSEEDFFIHLCTHLYKEATTFAWVKMKRDLSLYKFVDIYVLVSQCFHRDFAEKLLKRIEEIGLQKECFFTLFYTKELFQIHHPDLDFLIHGISTPDSSFINRIYNPGIDVEYEFHMDFTEWIFLPNRAAWLKEIEK